jgi:dipeptidyl aminopeptidase/acylaminoacyl peptidase
MKYFLPILVLAINIFVPFAWADTKNQPYPLDYFATRDQMNDVQITSDGKYFAFLKISSKQGDPTIEVYETADLSKKPYRIGGGKLEITGFNWISDEDMVVIFRGRVRKRISGFNRGVFQEKLAKFNVKTKEFKEFKQFGLGFVGSLPEKPNKILITFTEGVKNGRRAEGKAIRRPNYYEMDLKTGSRKIVMKGSEKYGRIRFDHKGNPRTALGFNQSANSRETYYRKPGQKSWEKIFSVHEDDFEEFAIAGYVKDDPSLVYALAHNGRDMRALWLFNVDTKEFETLVYSRSDVELGGVRMHSNPWTNPGEVVGVSYNKEKRFIKFFDQGEEALMNQLADMVPYSGFLRVVTRSRDGNTFVVVNFSPQDTGSYYLYDNGQFQFLGSKKGLLKSKNLAEVKYVQYKARDGKKIPGYVTIPKGEGPFPLVVMPHGGPFVGEAVFYFDEWAQLLANNGYMVLQPQYRGSHGYGLEFYKSAFIDGGEGGYKMQDDKDDGAKYLVEQGLVDPDRIAMFGWSYGGYAALVAASRSPNIYQCVVAGAAVADNVQQVNYYRSRTRGTQKLEQLKFWDDSVNPIKEVAKINVPMLIVHGDVDQRVPFKHFKRYTAELDKNNIKYDELVLEGADHFSNSLTYDHKIKFYTKMIDFLENDCGPGGL